MKTSMMAVLLSLCCSLHAQQSPIVFSSAGSDAAAIKTEVDRFRDALGPLNPPGPTGDPNGRREINWDAVPDAVAAPNALPPNFFNANSVRGAVFSFASPGWSSFQVSANDGVGPVRFGEFNGEYSNLFTTFSPQRLFTSVGTNDYDVNFFVPGTDTKATVTGFGAVFTNVALDFSSTLEFFNSDGYSLGKFAVRKAPKGLSFLGVMFPGKVIAKVRVTPGTASIGQAEDLASGVNIAVVDDFLYGEPVSKCGCK
jgi:hypothetical protein